MKAVFAVAFLFLVSFAPSQAAASQEHPIVKVISLIEDLEKKVEHEGKEEGEVWRKYEYWATRTLDKLAKAIAQEEETMKILGSKIRGKDKEIATLEEEIAGLEADLARMDKEQKEAQEQRDKELEVYNDRHNNDETTIGALRDALTVLKNTKHQIAAGASLVQFKQDIARAVALMEVSGEDASMFEAFLEEDPRTVKAAGDHDAHVQKYDFKSDKVMEMLEDKIVEMRNKFRDHMFNSELAETEAANKFRVETISRKNLSDRAKVLLTEKRELLQQAKQDRNDLKANFDAVHADWEADTELHRSTEKDYHTKTDEWEERSGHRKGEQEAMQQAVKVLEKVANVRTEAPENPIPPPSPEMARAASFLQLQKQVDAVDPSVGKVIAFLREQVKKTHSHSLEKLAMEIAAKPKVDHFDSMKQMIQKMIFRLMKEQRDEDEKKNWCDTEVSETLDSRSDKTDHIEDLNLRIEDARNKVALRNQDLSDEREIITKVATQIKEMTEIREIGHRENTETLNDARAAQEALKQAISVLETHYKQSGEIPKEPWEFVQTKSSVHLAPAPETWTSPYSGVSDPNNPSGGVIFVLNEVAANFAQVEAETMAQETEDKENFQNELRDMQIEKKRRDEEYALHEQEKKTLVDKITSLTTKKEKTTDQLNAVNKYYKELTPACLDGDSAYEKRKEARSAEINSLQQSQDLLRDAFKEKNAGKEAKETYAKQWSNEEKEAAGAASKHKVGFLDRHQ